MENPNHKLHGIHIGGTNGKGSTCAMCEAILQEHEYTTGLNTSPHLVDYRERIRVNGENIDLDTLIELYKKWENVFEEYEASFFEITTTMAFRHFMDKQVDTAIFEVGLGGRLDGTRPFESDVTVISSIGIDHPKSLGDTIEKIAFEKSGILKVAKPLVLGDLPPNAVKVIKDEASKLSVPVYEFGDSFVVNNIKCDKNGTHFDYALPELNIELNNVTVNLLGEHQARNAANAITACILYFKARERELDFNKLRSALAKVNWQGRMQILSQDPTIIIDGAHNDEGINALVKNVNSIFGKKVYVVLAILRDKNLTEMIKRLCTISEKVYISKNKSKRAAEIEDQLEAVQVTNTPHSVSFDVIEALEQARSEVSKDDIILITGSLYTISEVIAVKDKLFNA
jgi:dihydrofolate synthase/folylpolyglutamate synthase